MVHLSLGGSQLRDQISDAFGDAPLLIAAAHVATSLGDGTIHPESDRAITVRGRSSFTIPPGALVESDPLAFADAPFADLAVTLRLPAAPAAITAHSGFRSTSFLQSGDVVSAPAMPAAVRTDHWYFLSRIEVAPAAPDSAVVFALGDSITDGRGSTTNRNTRWPDFLARRLRDDPVTVGVGVLNAGIGGTRILGDGLGPGALARFERDVLVPTGVRWQIVFEGVNDIGGRGAGRQSVANDLIVAYKQMIRRAHARGIRVFGATITPFGGSFYDSLDHEADRQAVNRWIRESGAFDAVIDFDAALRDPQHPERMLGVADTGDHLHLNDEGFRRMGATVGLRMFARD